jgi:hypothetical protein
MGFRPRRTVSTRGFVCLSARPASTCPAPSCAACPPSSAGTAGSSAPGGGVRARAGRLCSPPPTFATASRAPSSQPVSHRDHDGPPVRRRGRRVPGRPRPDSRGGGSDGIDEGVRAAGRHPASDRPHRRGPAVVLRQAQEARDERAGPGRSGRLLWPSPALPGAVHDVRTAREHGITAALADAGITCWADKGDWGAGGTVRVPYWGRRENLSTGQKAVNRSQAKIRALVEQAVATLKSWRLLRALRCSTTRITSLVQAVPTLHLASSDR